MVFSYLYRNYLNKDEKIGIVTRLNRTILISLLSFVIGSVITFSIFIFSVGAAMTPSPDYSPIVVYSLLFLSTLMILLPFFIFFFTPVWYFFIRKNIVESNYTMTKIFFFLLILNFISTVIDMTDVQHGVHAESLEMVPYYFIILFIIIISMRGVIYFVQTTKPRSHSIYKFIQFSIFYFLFANLFFTTLGIIQPKIEEIPLLEGFLIVFILVMSALIPILFLYFLYCIFRNKRIIS